MDTNPLPKDYCFRENAFFPVDQFIDDPKWGKVHKIKPWHTILGTVIEPDQSPPPVPLPLYPSDVEHDQ